MRLTEFGELMVGEFGTLKADAILSDHVLIDHSGRTGAQAIEDGVDPRDVWLSICADFDVPREHR